MAQEEIKLVGTFKDDITPKLQKMNRSITTIGKSFKSFGHKLKPITTSFNKMADASQRFAKAMNLQAKGITDAGRAMRGYRQNANKMAGAMRKVTEARVKSQRQMGMSRAEARKSGGMAMPGMGGGGKGAKGGGVAAGKSAAKGFNGGIKSVAIGSAIGSIAAQGIMKGVQGLKNLAMAPFKKFGAMFAERVGDEMDDIKSAGGLFALDMDLTQESGNERFFKNYNEALRFQEKLNISMAESAASLPGVTSQYVDTSRQLTDTIQMVMEKDRKGFNEMAAGMGANVSMGGVDASKNAFQTVLQKQTEQVMLMSQGQKGGLPMHIALQQLLSKEAKGGKIGMQAFTNKYRAAFQKNPMLKNMLMRAEEEMAKTGANSTDRLKSIIDVFEKALPKEQINKMRGSISGMMEALRSGLLDPQAGLFGMSRANIDADGNAIMKDNVDDFGKKLFKISGEVFAKEGQIEQLKKLGIDAKVDDTLKGMEFTAEQLKELGIGTVKAGKILNKENVEIGKISQSSTYIFEQIREILAGFGPVLLEFVGFLPKLFDPFAKMTKALIPFRDKAQDFIAKFNDKLDGVDARVNFLLSGDTESQGKGNILKGQGRSRAALSTVAEYLNGLGAINKDLFDQIQSATGDASYAGIDAFQEGIVDKFIGPMLKQLMDSPLMGDFGQIGGQIVGGIINMILEMVNMFTGVVQGQGTNVFLDGFKKGFQDAFDGKSFGDIKGIISDALSAVFIKVSDLVVTRIVPALIQILAVHIQSLFNSLLTGGLTSKILAAIGIIKTFGLVITAVTAVVTTITGVITTVTGIIGFLSANFALLSGIAGTLVVALGPILLIALGIAGLILIISEFGAVVDGIIIILKMFGTGFNLTMATLKLGIARLLDWIPGLDFSEQVKEADTERLRHLDRMNDLAGQLGDNTQASLNRTRGRLGMDTVDDPNRIGPPVPGAPADTEGSTPKPTRKHQGGGRAKSKSKTPAIPPAEIAKNVAAVTEQTTAVAKQTVVSQEATEALTTLQTQSEETATAVKTSLEGAATEAGAAITLAAKNLATALNSAASSLQIAGKAGGKDTEVKYDGKGGTKMGLGEAIATERKHMPAGANLVIANSSETVIPAFNGHVGQAFKGLKFEEMEAASGFNRMKSYTDQLKEIADKTAEKFSGGGPLGGGSATLNAMEALGHAGGLTTTSGFRPGDPGYHGANRARDLSDGAGETPGMNKVAAQMASQYGASLTELIYTPLGYSIKNGQKTGLISPDNHYHHIHVAVAEGLAKAAVFSSEQAALSYEKSMMPGGASPMKVDLSSMTANSSEFAGGGGLTVGDVHVNVSGVDNPKEIATVVADEILAAVQRATYTELHTS